MYNIKTIREEFKAKGIFYTQPELAEYIKSLIDVEITDVYDPTCGDGGLLCVFPDDLPKFGQEINGYQLDVARDRLINFTGICGDTLKTPAFMDMRFSCIVANPPFSIAWEPKLDDRFSNAPVLAPKSKADYAFILHIIHLLANDGVAVVLNFPGILYRGNSEGKIRRWLIESNLIEKVIYVPGGTFVDTNIATTILVIKKNKNKTDIYFEDRQIEKSRSVSINEIEANDYILSVSTYVQEEKIITKHDPGELQIKSRRMMLEKIKADINIDMIVCEIEGYDFNEYLHQLEKLINTYKN